ncbi:MAG: hypothetical protein ABI165_08975 [Bryobacteraceae bacterium]
MARKYILLLLSASILAFAQPTVNTSITTGGMLNGRAWDSSSRDSRLLYIHGIEDGLVLAAGLVAPGPDQASLLKHAAPDFRPSDYVDEINAFYQDHTHAGIPIFYAWEYVNAKFKGATQDHLESMMRSFRAFVARH